MASTAVSGTQYTMVIEDTEKKVNDAIKALTYAQSLNLSGTTAAGSGVAGPTAAGSGVAGPTAAGPTAAGSGVAGSGVAGTTNSGSTLVKFPEAFTVMESLSKPLSFTSSPALYK
jgi:hypothetical protein